MPHLGVGEVITLLGTMTVLSPVWIVHLIVRHREKLEAMKLKQDSAPVILQQMEALRQEMASLRETTTRFDMSFDAALNRVEQRLNTLEDTTQATPTQYARQYNTEDTPAETVLRRR